MSRLIAKANKKGNATAEASIVLPLILMLVISIIFYVIKISTVEIESCRYDLTEKIKAYDSIERKADMVFETLFK
ncbi:MAG: hypothetical protein WC332_01820 [Clostridia bacterium]|jgi:uncharacterized protein (UPF0333 family)